MCVLRFQKKDELAANAHRNTRLLTWVGLGLMSLQFGVLARLTWWEYSWDIMEPVTYFVTYGTSMALYAYFVLTRQVSRSTRGSFLLYLFNDTFSTFLLTVTSVSETVVRCLHWSTDGKLTSVSGHSLFQITCKGSDISGCLTVVN